MILSYDKFWSCYLANIDIKCHEFPWTNSYWANEARRSNIRMWVEKIDNVKTLHGFIAYRFVSVNELQIKKIEGIVIHIEKLAVHPDFRGKGIGTKLLENVEATVKLQDVNTLITILHEEDDEGRKWLIKHGFMAHGLHKKSFPDGRDGYVFVKVIK